MGSVLVRTVLEVGIVVAIGGLAFDAVRRLRRGLIRAPRCEACGRPVSRAYPRCKYCDHPRVDA